jgi:hypothetical protein
MVHATDIAFYLSNHDMHPGYHLYRILPNAHDYRLRDSVPIVQHPIGTPAIAPAHHLLIKSIHEHLGDLFATELFDLVNGHKAPLISLGFHRDYHLVRIEVDIVSLNETCKLTVGISLCYGLSDLGAYGLDLSGASYLQYPFKGEHGNAAPLATHKENYPEPLPQGGSGLMENILCSERDVILACLIL